jgi:hypothetical protein
MSLDQYLGQLGEDHYARKQYAELKANALKAVDYANQVIELQGKIMALQDERKPNPVYSEPTPKQEERPIIPKKPCPTCGKIISSSPGPWAVHQKQHNPVI